MEIQTFKDSLCVMCRELARMIVKDGEGATKFINIHLKGAKSEDEADIGARVIANSILVKTAIFGIDPNWGRIMAAIGRSGISVDPNNIDIWIGGTKVVERGVGRGPFYEDKARERMKQDEIEILIDLHIGDGEAEIWTTDLSYEYIKINAEYRT